MTQKKANVKAAAPVAKVEESKASAPIADAEAPKAEEFPTTAKDTEVAVEEVFDPMYGIELSPQNKYWRGSVHIKGVGVVSGEARQDHIEKFIGESVRLMDKNLSSIDQKVFDIDDWLLPVDKLAIKQKKDKAKMKQGK